MSDIAARASAQQLGTLADLGLKPPDGAHVLDVGCGAGGVVQAYRDLGFEAIGCDLQFKNGPWRERLELAGHLRKIELEPYRLPIEDNWAELVVSDQVLEHVHDHESLFSELHRVLRPGGVMLHVYPATLRPLEPHVRVPMAGVWRSSSWLGLWALLVVRSPSQRGMAWFDVRRANVEYLSERTNYLSAAEMKRRAMCCFDDVAFVEAAYVRHGGRARFVASLAKYFPMAIPLYRTFSMRALIARKGA